MNDHYQSHIPPGMLIRIIQDKQDKIAYYEQLHKMTADQQDIAIIRNIREEEIVHFHAFINLYTELFAEQPSFSGSASPQIDSFISGVKNAIMFELDAYTTYSNVLFTDTNPGVRNAFVRVLIDENKHAIKYNFIFANCLKAENR